MAAPVSKKGALAAQPWFTAGRHGGLLRPFHKSSLEALEPRWMLSAAPTLTAIGDVALASGTPLYIALDGYDADGDTLTFSFESTNSNLSTTLSETNHSMKISVAGYGDMVFELFENLAPDVTARIIELAEAGFYDGLTFHRVAEYSDGTPFVIQGGDPDGNGTGGSGADFDDQFNPLLMHTSSGVLSMAKSNDDTNDSQFFITATATRHLDFNHSVFGYLVEGENVRAAIQGVATDSNGAPLTNVVMESVEVFVDEANGVLILSAPEGYSGEADVTVTVSDGNGGSAQRTFHVTIEPDTVNDNPYLEPIDPVELNAGATTQFTLGAVDLEGSDVQFAGILHTETNGIQLAVDADTGKVTVTAAATAGGIYGIYLGAANTSGSTWDTQVVPVMVTPAAPSGIDLLTSSDTGQNTSDNLTSLNNTTDQSLWFRVSGLVAGATVTLLADGHVIGQTVATSDSAIVITNESHALTDGAHVITAVQGFYNMAVDVGNSGGVVTLESGVSPSLTIAVDTTPPVVTSEPITEATAGVQYVYDVQSDAETTGGAVYSLAKSPSGMLINSQTGQITWIPAKKHGADQEVIVAVEDAAGNDTQHTFVVHVNRAPEIWPPGNHQIEEGSTLIYEVIATDPDVESEIAVIVFSLDAGAPAGASIHPYTGVFTWTPTEADGPGSYTVWIRATDDGGATSAEIITVAVAEKNEPPTLGPIAGATVDEGVLLEFSVAATDPDLPANVLTYSLAAGSPAGAAIDPASGRFTWRPGEQHGDSQFDITVLVADAGGLTDQQTFHVVVNEVDNAPEFVPADVVVAQPGTLVQITAKASDPDVVKNTIRYAFDSTPPEGATIDANSGLIRWQIPESQPQGSVYFQVRATEILDDSSLGLASVATLELQVVVSPVVAFDQALILSGNTPVLAAQIAREAVDSLLFDSVRAIRFMPITPASPAAADHAALFGFQIGTHGGRGTPVKTPQPPGEPSPEGQHDPNAGPKPASHQTEKAEPDGQTADVDPFQPVGDRADEATEMAQLAPRELLDAAMQALADETQAAAVDQALEAR